MIQAKQMWDIQANTVAMTGDFDEDKNPLFALKSSEDKNRKMTVEEAQQFISMMS